MKRLFKINPGILIILISTLVWAVEDSRLPSVSNDFAKAFSCQKDVESWEKYLTGITIELGKDIDRMNEEEVIDSLLNSDERLEFLSIVKPEVLVKKVPSIKMYQECAVKHNKIVGLLRQKKGDKLINQSISVWQSCLKYGYRDQLPVVANKMIDCYRGLSSSYKSK